MFAPPPGRRLLVNDKTRTDQELPPEVRQYFSSLGRKGGAAKGDAKRRGDAGYYSELAKRRKPKAKQAEPQG
jgi:hypothetical protein